MAEGWKQIWEDLRNALRSNRESKPAASATPASEVEPVTSADAAPDPQLKQTAAESEPDTEPISLTAPFEAQPAPISEGDTVGSADEIAPGEARAPAGRRPRLWGQRALLAGVVLAIGAALLRGAWLAGGEQWWAQWSAPTPPAPDVLATFDGGKITIADLEAHLNVLVPNEYSAAVRSPEILRLVAEEMASDELARRWAATHKKDADETFQHTMQHITEAINLDSFSAQLRAGGIPVPESEIQAYYDANKAQFGDQTLSAVREPIRQALAGQKEGQYLKDYIEQLKTNAAITRDFALLDVSAPREADVRAYYEANTESYTVTARFTVDLLAVPVGADEAAARAVADTVLLKLRAGERLDAIPAQVADTQVITNTAVAAGANGGVWDAALFALRPGEFSDVLRTGDSFYIARLIQMRPSRTMTFAEARPQVLETVGRQRVEQWMQKNAAKTLFILKSKSYTLGQFYKEYRELRPEVQAQFAGPQGMQDLAERLIERLLLVEDTYDQLLQVKNKDLIDQTGLDVLKQMMDQQEVDDLAQATDVELREYYAQNPERMRPPPKVRLRYIRIGLGTSPEEQAAARVRTDEVYKRLVPPFLDASAAADFDEIAKAYSEDTETANNGGLLPGWMAEDSEAALSGEDATGWIGAINRPPDLPELHTMHRAIHALEVGTISRPIDVGDSLYIIKLLERVQPPPLSFAEARPYIAQALAAQKHDNLGQQLQERLARQANLVVYDRALQAYVAQYSSTDPSAKPQSEAP